MYMHKEGGRGKKEERYMYMYRTTETEYKPVQCIHVFYQGFEHLSLTFVRSKCEVILLQSSE